MKSFHIFFLSFSIELSLVKLTSEVNFSVIQFSTELFIVSLGSLSFCIEFILSFLKFITHILVVNF